MPQHSKANVSHVHCTFLNAKIFPELLREKLPQQKKSLFLPNSLRCLQISLECSPSCNNHFEWSLSLPMSRIIFIWQCRTNKQKSSFLKISIYLFYYLFIWLLRVLVVAGGLLSCGMWTLSSLIPWPGIKPGPPALGSRSLNHCATREVPQSHSWLLAPKLHIKSISRQSSALPYF